MDFFANCVLLLTVSHSVKFHLNCSRSSVNCEPVVAPLHLFQGRNNTSGNYLSLLSLSGIIYHGDLLSGLPVLLKRLFRTKWCSVVTACKIGWILIFGICLFNIFYYTYTQGNRFMIALSGRCIEWSCVANAMAPGNLHQCANANGYRLHSRDHCIGKKVVSLLFHTARGIRYTSQRSRDPELTL